MEKRKIIFGTYDTATEGLWTLTECVLSKPALKESYVTVPGHDGDLDLSTVLTDGEPRYGNRSLTATFESSEGTRADRDFIISEMVNKLDGLRMNIVLPDDPQRYVTGRVSVEPLYNDLAHASVKVTANCEPWRYNAVETVVGLADANDWRMVHLYNMGRRSVVPTITVPKGGYLSLGFGAPDVALGEGKSDVTLGEGTHVWPTLYLPRGTHVLHYMCFGSATISYREAVL